MKTMSSTNKKRIYFNKQILFPIYFLQVTSKAQAHINLFFNQIKICVPHNPAQNPFGSPPSIYIVM